MRWPWSRRKHERELEELERTRKRLEDVRKQWPIVMAVSQTLKSHHERNHFADSLAIIFRGGEEDE